MTTAETSEQQISRAIPRESVLGLWAVFWIAVIATSAPMLLLYFSRMWSMERYQYFPFVFIAIGFLLYKRFDRRFVPPANWYRWSQVALGTTFVVASILLGSPWLSAIGFVLTMASFLGSSRDTLGRSLVPLILPLLMIVRLPLGYDQLLVIKLQSITTELSSVLLDLFRVPHVAAANVIRLPQKELFVAEACSGIQSVFTLAFLALVVVTFFERRIWLTPVYLLIAILLAVAANVMRVTGVALGEAWYGVDLASGWAHDLIGYAALVIAVLFLLSFDQLVMTMLHPVEPPDDGPVVNPLIAGWNWLVEDDYHHPSSGMPRASDAMDSDSTRSTYAFLRPTWVRATFGILAGIVALGSAAQATRLAFSESDGRDSNPRELVFSVPSDLLARVEYDEITVGGHDVSRGGSNPRLGDNADVWQVSSGDVVGQMVLSQPYTGWHELCMCYEIQDWLLINREVIEATSSTVDAGETAEVPLAFARLKSQSGAHGYLLYTCLGSDGDVIAPRRNLVGWEVVLMILSTAAMLMNAKT